MRITENIGQKDMETTDNVLTLLRFSNSDESKKEYSQTATRVKSQTATRVKYIFIFVGFYC